jgi:hypothetical protein
MAKHKPKIQVINEPSRCGPHYWLDFVDPKKCAYKLTHLPRIQQAVVHLPEAFQVGLLGHAMLAHYFDRTPRSRRHFDPFACDFVDTDGRKLPYSHSAYVEAALGVVGIISAGLWQHAKTLATEQSFATQAFGRARVGGRADLIVQLDDCIAVVDYKFLRLPDTHDALAKIKASYSKSVQLATYRLHAQAYYRQRVIAILLPIWNSDMPDHSAWEFDKTLPRKKDLDVLYTRAYNAKRKPSRNFTVCGRGKARCPLYTKCLRYAK